MCQLTSHSLLQAEPDNKYKLHANSLSVEAQQLWKSYVKCQSSMQDILGSCPKQADRTFAAICVHSIRFPI